MRVLFIGGVFDDIHYSELISKTKTHVEYAANLLQQKIIKGLLSQDLELDILSAPFIGAYPHSYTEKSFKGFSVEDNSNIEYVHFNNIFGVRNFSRNRALKAKVREFTKMQDPEKYIVIYSPHTPFMKAANYAKKLDETIKTCLIVPDLPQYMNLSKKKSLFYRIAKTIDLRVFYKENITIDSFVVLTYQMVDVLKVNNRPYEVIEGAYEPNLDDSTNVDQDDLIKIAYVGKLNESFGVLNLIKAFSLIKEDRFRLIICGGGEAEHEVTSLASNDSRIDYRGLVSHDEAMKVLASSSILVNPRMNDSEYTKYSFPSKIIEYLSLGKPVIAYKLDGMPEIYKNFIHFVNGSEVTDLRDAIMNVANTPRSELLMKQQASINYLQSNLSPEAIGQKLIKLYYKSLVSKENFVSSL